MPGLTIGFILPNSGPLATAAHIELVADHIERLGFDTVWLGDHIVMPRNVASRYPYTEDGAWPANPAFPSFEPIVTLSYVAARTTRVRLGLSVLVVPYRNPVATAKMLATLDNFSRGRLTVGCGVGWLEEEFRALGLSTFRNRGAVTDEYLRIFKVLWTERSPSFLGRFHEFADITCDPKPVQQPHPPLWIGGHTSAALRRAVELGDGWQAVRIDQPTFAACTQELRERAARAGRDPESLSISVRLVVDPFRAASEGRAPDPNDASAPLSGSPEEVAEKVRGYIQAGAGDLVFEFPRNRLTSMSAGLDIMNWIGEELRPRIQASSA
ncbi:MAG: LLM class F420-dependent oxidoreductase [Chloroflexi bacterium]|nr:LLM class F420-dependent oxidoreductase [Chloroflexota bacterium]